MIRDMKTQSSKQQNRSRNALRVTPKGTKKHRGEVLSMSRKKKLVAKPACFLPLERSLSTSSLAIVRKKSTAAEWSPLVARFHLSDIRFPPDLSSPRCALGFRSKSSQSKFRSFFVPPISAAKFLSRRGDRLCCCWLKERGGRRQNRGGKRTWFRSEVPR